MQGLCSAESQHEDLAGWVPQISRITPSMKARFIPDPATYLSLSLFGLTR